MIVGEANHFTSYDLLQAPALDGSWLPREDLAAGRTWYLQAYDAAVNKKGQIEYLQFQVAVHTLPNRADTDRDGYADNVDWLPLADACFTVTIVSPSAYGGTDDDATPNALEPFVAVSDGAAPAFTRSVPVVPGGTASYYHQYSANVPDDQRYLNVYFWVYDHDPDDTHEAFAINGTATYAVAVHDLFRGPAPRPPSTSPAPGTSGSRSSTSRSRTSFRRGSRRTSSCRRTTPAWST